MSLEHALKRANRYLDRWDGSNPEDDLYDHWKAFYDVLGDLVSALEKAEAEKPNPEDRS